MKSSNLKAAKRKACFQIAGLYAVPSLLWMASITVYIRYRSVILLEFQVHWHWTVILILSAWPLVFIPIKHLARRIYRKHDVREKSGSVASEET